MRWQQRTGDDRAIQGLQFADQEPHRPAIGDDVVNRQQQNVVCRIQSKDSSSQDRSRAKIEGFLEFLFGSLTSLRQPVPILQVRQIFNWDLQILSGADLLDDGVILDMETRTQRLVALNDFPERPLQRRHVQITGQQQGRGDVVRCVTPVHLVQDPQPFLCKGKGQCLIPVHAHQGVCSSGGRLIAGSLAQPVDGKLSLLRRETLQTGA